MPAFSRICRTASIFLFITVLSCFALPAQAPQQSRSAVQASQSQQSGAPAAPAGDARQPRRQQQEMQKAPPRAEGEGPFPHLIIRGVTLIDGTGAPPVGPVDIVIEQNRIAEIRNVGAPHTKIDPARRPKAGPGDHELNCEGMYALPGFIDMHTHIGPVTSVPAEYIFKLWMGHGVTTIREVLAGNGIDWMLDERAKSDRNEITAPRIKSYVMFGMGAKQPITTPQQA
ncbi:MAG TPA: hypothetical protein VKB56_05355, partial [Terriglobales bacterium]|nr:hypothetical protein [Terriglobales bacterium]